MTRPPLMILHVFATFAAGGSQVRTAQLINAFGDMFRHKIVAMDGCYEALSLLNHPHLVVSIPPPSQQGNIFTRLWRNRRWVRAQNADVVATYNWGAIEVAAAARFCPGVVRIHHEDGFGPEEAEHQISRRVMFRRLILNGDIVTVVPSKQLQSLALKAWRLPVSKVKLIENGVDISAFGPAKATAIPDFQKQDGELIIGTVAGLRAEKNISRLVRAFAGMGDVGKSRLLIIGEGKDRDIIVAEARRHGVLDRLIMPGFIANPQNYLGLFDIFVLSSDTEQFPISLVEAMAASCAVTATNVGDIASIMPDIQKRFIVKKNDEGALTRTLKHLAGNAELRQNLGKANRAKVALAYSFDKTSKAYQALYKGN